MKILMVCTTIPKEKSEWWRIYNIAQIFKSNGHHIQFIHYCRESIYKKMDNKEKYSNHIFITFKSLASAPINIHIKHLKILLKGNYDLVYCNGPCSVFYSLFGKITSIPLIFDMHGDIIEEFHITNPKPSFSSLIKLNFVKLIYFSSIRFSDLIFCVSNKEIKFLNYKKGIPLKKMHYITNGVDLEFFKSSDNEKIKELKKRLGIRNHLVFGYIGDFQKWQGIENLINAAKNISDQNIKFIFVGGNIEIENINVIPWIPREEIGGYYSICDVLVLPRPNHPATEVAAPTKFSEYIAMGKPILTTKVGDAADLVKKYECGIVVKDNSPENLIEGIYQFANLSKEKLDLMGKNSRKLAESEFNWNIIGQKLSSILNF